MSTTLLEAPVVVAPPPVVEAAPTPLLTPIPAPAALPTPAPVAPAPRPAFVPMLTTSDYFTASAISVEYEQDATISISDDVTFPTGCTVEMDLVDTSANGSATQSFAFEGIGRPWRKMDMYFKSMGTTTSIKKLRLKGYVTKAHWGYKNFACTSATWGNYTLAGNTWCASDLYWGHTPYEKTKEELFREKLQANLRPEIVTKNQQLWGLELTEEELRARTLLYDLIGDLEFRRYLRKGFIMVTGKSGTMYKISGGHNRIVSYKKANTGRFMPFEEFCVVFAQYNLPFTDGVIMRKLLVEHDEFSLRKKANVFQVGEPGKFTATPATVLRAG